MEEFPTLHCTEQQSKDPTAPSGILALSLPPESGPPPSEVQGHGAGFSGEHSPLRQPSVLISCPGQVLQQPYMPYRGRHQPTLPCLRFCLLERHTLSLRAPVSAASWEGPAQGTTAVSMSSTHGLRPSRGTCCKGIGGSATWLAVLKLVRQGAPWE